MGKFYSAGLDINTETPLNQDPHQIAHDMGLLQKLVARLLTFPLPTIAAITGLVHLPPVFMRFPSPLQCRDEKHVTWTCILVDMVGAF